MDAMLLRSLDTERVNGPAFFSNLFRQVPAERLLRFLDGATSLREEWSIGLRTPRPGDASHGGRTALRAPSPPPDARTGDHHR